IRAETLLQDRREPPLDPHHPRGREQQRVEDDERQGELRDEERAQCAPTGCRARQSATSVQRPSRTCASYSCRKCFSVVTTGVTAASPKAQSVLPPMFAEMLDSRSRSRIWPSPLSIFWRILCSQSVPSRHGVHLPHDSWR